MVHDDEGFVAGAHFRVAKVGGLDIFYREAGTRDAPTVLLLHGFPTSSHMFRDLIPLLADRYHLIAPDYPGFGYSSTPSVTEFEYTFDRLAEVMRHFTDSVGLKRYGSTLRTLAVRWAFGLRPPCRSECVCRSCKMRMPTRKAWAKRYETSSCAYTVSARRKCVQ